MSPRPRAGFLVILLAAFFTYGLIHLFTVQFAAGDVYPELSSLRTDPGGSKLLYDSLARTPGLTVTRSLLPLDGLEEHDSAILLLSVDPQEFGSAPEPSAAEPFLKTVERLANRGNRIVVAMNGASWDHPPATPELERQWHVRFDVDRAGTPAHRLYFAQATDWNVLDRAGAKPLAVERTFGSGSVVLLSESDAFNNISTAAMDRLTLVSAVIGPATRVIFDEHHFGIAESGSVVGLARRFRLTGMALGLAVCAVLFLWKNTSSFPPPAAAALRERLTGRTSLSGLLTLLRRHIPPRDLAATCWREWLAANRRSVTPERLRQAETILQDRAAAPLDAVREIQTVLHAKGPL